MSASDAIDRSRLPIPDLKQEHPTILDAKDPAATFAPIEELQPPADRAYIRVRTLLSGFASRDQMGEDAAEAVTS